MAEEKKLPYDAVTGEELVPREMPGYYPGFSTLAQAAYWDEATHKTITERVEKIPPVQFFRTEEAALLEAILARIMPQDDRTPERRIPILPWIDQRLYRNELNGYRYEDMPPDQDAYRLGLAAVEAMAQQRFAAPFAQLTVHRQELLLQSIHDGKPDPSHEHWQRMKVDRWWALLLGDAVNVYYAHPWAWDEIGFGGPAYPRGYMRLEGGLPEPWEVEEKRNEWNAPVDSVSGDAKPPAEDSGPQGHGGTH